MTTTQPNGSSPVTILVTGATGTVGGEVARLLADSAVDLRIVVRDPSTAQLPVELDVVQGDLTVDADLDRVLAGVDRAFLNMPDDNGEAFAAAAARAGVGHVVLLSSFTATTELPSGDANIITARHSTGERLLAEAGIPFTALRATGFDYNILQWTAGLAEDVVRAPFVDVQLPKVDPRDIAASAAAILLDPAGRRAAYSITGPETISTRQEVEVVGGLLGRDLRVEELTVEQAAEAGFPEGVPDVVRISVLETLGDAGASVPPSRDVQEITGQPARTFRDWARDHVGAFQAAVA